MKSRRKPRLTLRAYKVPYEVLEDNGTGVINYSSSMNTGPRRLRLHTYIVHHQDTIRKLCWRIEYGHVKWIPVVKWWWGEAEPTEAIKLMAHGYNRHFSSMGTAVHELLRLAFVSDSYTMSRKFEFYAQKDNAKNIPFGDSVCDSEGDEEPSPLAQLQEDRDFQREA